MANLKVRQIETETIWIRLDVHCSDQTRGATSRMDDLLDDDGFIELLREYDMEPSMSSCDTSPDAINRRLGDAPTPLEIDDEEDGS